MVITLRAADVQKLTHALDSLAQVTEKAAFPRTALDAARSVVPCQVATYNEVNPDGSLIVWWPDSVPRPPDTAAILSRYQAEHPLINAIVRTGDGSARAISDFLSPDEFRTLNLYRLIYGPMGLADQLAIGLPAPLPLVIGIALNRERRGFDERDRLLANLIRPFLIQAHRSVQLAAALESATALGLQNRVAAFVSGLNRVEPLQGAFPSWFPADAIFPQGRLDDPMADWLAAQSSPRADTDGLPALSAPLIRGIAGVRWVLRYVLTPSGRVIVASRGSQGVADQEDILRALGLTQREATVLRLICQGASNSEIARSLRITVSAVKRHVESTYRKLGVRKRSEATALAIDTMA